jgi:peptide/nickel transport system permease protein
MEKFLIRRVLNVIPLLFVITLIAFVLIRMAPGDPVSMYLSTDLEDANPETVARIREELGLNRPIIVQYFAWLWRAIQGDLGNSLQTRRPVTTIIAEVLPNSIWLAAASLTVAFVVGILLGVLTAVRQRSFLDYTVSTLVFIGYSLPSYYIALLLLYVLSFRYQLLPSSGMRSLRGGPENETLDILIHSAMPLLAYITIRLVQWVRFQRNSMIEVMSRDYIRTARAKGLTERRVIFKHAWRNSLTPIITQLGLSFSGLIGGSFIIESIFAWPGIGRLGLNAVRFRDFPVSMGILLISSIMIIAGNLLSDVLYVLLDPRIRLDRQLKS